MLGKVLAIKLGGMLLFARMLAIYLDTEGMLRAMDLKVLDIRHELDHDHEGQTLLDLVLYNHSRKRLRDPPLDLLLLIAAHLYMDMNMV
jgi:hypothetical protein|uniref:Uncharacterized protein n=2 Tax=Picea TaxID=3328 RepID=A0A101LVI7_PICGL|nr:hypothetical protein ABT39_MTgene1916 [Picea glauca]QHR89901.1 hypothetical protein Q903MT_gene3923 [Picea sitchensis]